MKRNNKTIPIEARIKLIKLIEKGHTFKDVYTYFKLINSNRLRKLQVLDYLLLKLYSIYIERQAG
jgi:hypothetical protein